VAWFSIEIWPPFESVMSFAVTLTKPVWPEEPSAAALILLESPSTNSVPASI
jgi:hypothetical protein